MPKIFLSYRRADSISATGRLHEHLSTAFGSQNVFKDVEDIPPGVDFRTFLSDSVNACDVVLVMIGHQWVGITNEEGKPRLHDPGDFVRAEVAAALANPKTLTIPVLVEGAIPPKADDLPDDIKDIAYRNAFQLRNDPDFLSDAQKLMASLDPNYDPNAVQSSAGVTAGSRKGLSLSIILGIALALVLVAVIVVILLSSGQTTPNDGFVRETDDIALLLDDFGADDYLDVGDVFNYELDEADEVTFVFDGLGGEVVEIFAGSEDFDPYLELYDAEGELLDENDDISDSDTDAAIETELPDDGVYQIVVFANGEETMTGDLTVSLELLE